MESHNRGDSLKDLLEDLLLEAARGRISERAARVRLDEILTEFKESSARAFSTVYSLIGDNVGIGL